MKPSTSSRWLAWLKRLAFVVAALVTLIVLGLAIEGYRAKRAWLACEQELESRGEKLRWNALVSPSVPNDQNALAAPILAACFGFDAGSARTGAETPDSGACDHLIQNLSWAHPLSPGDWREGTVVGLNDWQAKLRSDAEDGPGVAFLAPRYGVRPEPTPAEPSPPPHPAETSPAWSALRARPSGTSLEDLRFLLDHDRAVLDAIREAARRPFAQLEFVAEARPEMLTADLLPKFSRVKALVHPFRASCWTELVAGNPRAALVDFETMLALREAAASQPLLIGALVAHAITETAIQPLWAGLAEHRWSDAELAHLEDRLSRINLVADIQRCLRGERAFSLAMVSLQPASGPEDPLAQPDPTRAAMRHWPSALIYRNRINLALAYQSVLIDRLDPSGPFARVSPSAGDQALRQRFGRFSPYNCFAPQLLPAIEKSLENAARVQTAVALARVACALERLYLERGSYPESLDELKPRFLAQAPPDPFNGGTLQYRREAPDRFAVYSVGLNGRDDGGVPAPARQAASRVEANQGDIVWRSLAKSPAKASAPE
jgi:hypothetical protein